MVLEIKYVNANNAVIHTENLVTVILAKISLGTGIWAKFRLGTGIWYPPSRPSCNAELQIMIGLRLKQNQQLEFQHIHWANNSCILFTQSHFLLVFNLMIYTRSERITCLETLAHLANECKELLAQQENLLIPY